MRHVTVYVALAGLLWGLLQGAALAQDNLSYHPDDLSLTADIPTGSALSAVLTDLSRKTGIEVSLEQELTRPMYRTGKIAFKDLPLDEAVAVITAPYHFRLLVKLGGDPQSQDNYTPVALRVYRAWHNNAGRNRLHRAAAERQKLTPDAMLVGGNGRSDGLRHSTRDYQAGETTAKAFTYGHIDQSGDDAWIDEVNNPDLAAIGDGERFFAYVLGREHHSSALVRAEASRGTIGKTADALSFQFDVIQGQIDDDGESAIEYMTRLTTPSSGNGCVVESAAATLPDFEESGGSTVNLPMEDYYVKHKDLTRSIDNEDGWSPEFLIKEDFEDDDPNWWGYGGTDEFIINSAPLPEGYHLAYVKGGNDIGDTDEFEAYTLVHVYNGGDKARVLVLDGGYLEDDAWGTDNDVFINDYVYIDTLAANTSKNFDNVLYKDYREMYLLNAADKTSENSDILAEVLPSHLLYSPEDYTWDGARLELVKVGDEVAQPFVDDGLNAEGTLGAMFENFKNTVSVPADDERIPMIIIHGWRGDLPDDFATLHTYSWSMFGSITDKPATGQAYWRNFLTYMYKYHPEDFKYFKPYIYQYPTYKHVKFNARILSKLIDEMVNTQKDPCLRNGYNRNRIVIVGHSMGTIVSRTLMETYGLIDKVQTFISLAGVHHGSPGALQSLVDTSFFAGKAMYTPGCTDLMPDNYDGFFNRTLKADIQENWWLFGVEELLDQRQLAGDVYVDGTRYDTARNCYDFNYIEALGFPVYNNSGFDQYVKAADKEVPVFPNPWLLALNRDFYQSYRDKAKTRYIYYGGFVVAAPVGFAAVPEAGWQRTMTSSLSMDVAAGSVAGASGYYYLDSVVPVSYAAHDFSRGRLLKTDSGSAQLDTGYDTGTDMPAELPDYMSEDNREGVYLYKLTNDWGAKCRMVYDHDHDRMLNGGYNDVNAYRLNGSAGIGFGSSEAFAAYYQDVHPGEAADMKFENDPVFEQVRMDILNGAGLSQ